MQSVIKEDSCGWLVGWLVKKVPKKSCSLVLA